MEPGLLRDDPGPGWRDRQLHVRGAIRVAPRFTRGDGAYMAVRMRSIDPSFVYATFVGSLYADRMGWRSSAASTSGSTSTTTACARRRRTSSTRTGRAIPPRSYFARSQVAGRPSAGPVLILQGTGDGFYQGVSAADLRSVLAGDADARHHVRERVSRPGARHPMGGRAQLAGGEVRRHAGIERLRLTASPSQGSGARVRRAGTERAPRLSPAHRRGLGPGSLIRRGRSACVPTPSPSRAMP